MPRSLSRIGILTIALVFLSAVSAYSGQTVPQPDPNNTTSAQAQKSVQIVANSAKQTEIEADKTNAPKGEPAKPKRLMEIMLNGAAGFMGLPGLAGEQHNLYDPNADQGLGFHQDGTARRADGTTGNQAGNGSYDGRRAASYLNHGLGYGNSYGSGLGMAVDSDPHVTLGYDPVTGQNYGVDSPRNARRGSAFGDAFFTDPQAYFMQRGLNYGMGWLNSMGEAGFSGLMDNGRARLNFIMDQYGRLNGEGDVLLPFYDGTYTTLFTQLGARTMSGFGDDTGDGRGADRWIGNFGLGQRWFPGASTTETGKIDSGDWMLGYNVFFDNDFTRGHQRGGIGGEIQYDWLKLASNYYFPLSDWKGSRDFDNDFVEERPAQGWDVRLKGYLPFYRNVALTGAYTQWYGDNVSMYSTSKLEKDPNVWSYGVEYTPIPLVSAFVNQRSTGRGNNDTEFGLRFTYHFDMPWEQQTSHAKVAETRTVAAARHDFVDRENRIILEYKAKNNFHVEFIGRNGNTFTFRIKNGFNKYASGQTVRVSASGVTTLAEAKAVSSNFLAQAGEFWGDLFSVSAAYAADLVHSYITDRDGTFRVVITGLDSGSALMVQAGDGSRTFTAAELGGGGGASYSVDSSSLSVDNQGNLSGTVTVRNADSTFAQNVSVSILYKTYGGSGAQATSLALSGVTDASGVINASGSINPTPRKVILAAKAGSTESACSSAFTIVGPDGGTLPSGFLTGPSLNDSGAVLVMPWSAAKNYCASHGGRLPLIAGASSLPQNPIPSGPVDGFVSLGSSWPGPPFPAWTTGNNDQYFWTGTGDATFPGQAWAVSGLIGNVMLNGGLQSRTIRVACVP